MKNIQIKLEVILTVLVEENENIKALVDDLDYNFWIDSKYNAETVNMQVNNFEIIKDEQRKYD